MEQFRIKPLTEADFDEIVRAAGGIRLSLESGRNRSPNADYAIADSIVELKLLDDDGMAKPTRQAKLAALFKQYQPERPVVVLDRDALPTDGQRNYDRILEGPIQTAVAKARKQLKESKKEHPMTRSSVLMVVNNGYSALDHKALVRMVAHRARQDTDEIDGVVVAGCYFYSDGMDAFILCPIDYVPINMSRPFTCYELLRAAWNEFVDASLSPPLFGNTAPDDGKLPVIDTYFDIDGVRYVKPAPPMGNRSEFFVRGRPRKNSSGLTHCPKVARTFPDMARDEWHKITVTLQSAQPTNKVYEEWIQERAARSAADNALKPFVPIRIAHDLWLAWCDAKHQKPTMQSLATHANELFEQRVRALRDGARERTREGLVPSRYILVATEVIGQDMANDVSHIAVIKEQLRGEPVIRELVTNARIFHEHALALGCAYGVREGIDVILWQKHMEYAWT
jgi:hypothetical protein